VNNAVVYANEPDVNMNNNVASTETFPTDFNIPEGFSPNADGINDVFVIRGILNYPDNKFDIFNRWGDKVFKANPYTNTWDGKCSEGIRVGGDELPVGTYFYILDLGDGSDIIKGTIYLNR
jgi:gliding motility-associated-like protein